MRALRATLPNEVELSSKNVSIAIVGKSTEFHILTETETGEYLTMIVNERTQESPDDSSAVGSGTEQQAPEHMDTA